LEAAHGLGSGAGGVAEADEVEDAVKDIGKKLVAEAEAMALAEGGGDFGADDDLAVGEGEDIGRGGIAEVAMVETAALPGGDQDDADFRRQAAEPGGGKTPEGGVQLTTKIGQARGMPSLTVDPPEGRFFWVHGGPWGNGCGGEAGFPRRRPGLYERPATGRG
jgi:hypothetical protein